MRARPTARASGHACLHCATDSLRDPPAVGGSVATRGTPARPESEANGRPCVAGLGAARARTRAPSRASASGCRCGHSTASARRCLTSARPPTSAQRTAGSSSACSRSALGRTSVCAARTSAAVTCGRAGPAHRTNPARAARPAAPAPAPRARPPLSPALVPRFHLLLLLPHTRGVRAGAWPGRQRACELKQLSIESVPPGGNSDFCVAAQVFPTA
jgi:hypothetical protein